MDPEIPGKAFNQEDNLRIVQENKLLEEKFNQLATCSHVLFTKTSQSDFKQFLKSDSEEYFRFALNQCTILPQPGNNLMDILTEKGQDLYNQILQKVKGRLFKDTISEYTIQHGESGKWFALENSPWFDKCKPFGNGITGTFHSWQNVQINGFAEKQGRITTSSCVFFVQATESEDGWCYTKSGSLYNLKK